jgi:hypothetical protein
MTTTEVRNAVEAWAAEITGASTYDTKPASITETLPVVVGFVDRDQVRNDAPDDLGPIFEQQICRVWTVKLWLLVSPEPADTAETQLNEMVDELSTALGLDRTLGQRVDRASRFYDAPYQGEVQYEDGGIARQVEMTLTIAEALEAR